MADPIIKYIQGRNPWMDEKMTGIELNSIQHELSGSNPEIVNNIIIVYEFYKVCKEEAISGASEDDYYDEDSAVNHLISDPLVEIRTIAYFSHDVVFNALNEYRDLFPEEVYHKLSLCSRIRIGRHREDCGINIVYKDPDSKSPFPVCEPIN